MIYVFLEFLILCVSKAPQVYDFFSTSWFIPIFQMKGENGSRVSQVVRIELPSLLKTSGPRLMALGPHGCWSISGV